MECTNPCPACAAGIKTSVYHQIQVTDVQTKKKVILTVTDEAYTNLWEPLIREGVRKQKGSYGFIPLHSPNNAT